MPGPFLFAWDEIKMGKTCGGGLPKKRVIEIQASAEITDQINLVSVLIVIGKLTDKI
jgi:hypothetical protein